VTTSLSSATRAALRDLRRRRRFPEGTCCRRCGWGARPLARQLQREAFLPPRGLRAQSRRLEPQAIAALTRRRGEILCYRCRSGHQTELHHPAGRTTEPGWVHSTDSRLHRLVHALSGWQRFTPELAARLPGWLVRVSGAAIPGAAP
jgi:hypothetical protein